MDNRSGQIAGYFKMLANQIRIDILYALCERPMTVSEILEHTRDAGQSAVSQQLAKLRAAGIVECQKSAKNVYYAVRDLKTLAILSNISRDLNDELGIWDSLSPKELSELNPMGLLRDIGLQNGSVFCESGALPGVFTFNAAKITGGTVYSVVPNDDDSKMIENRSRMIGANYIISVKDFSIIPDDSCDAVLLFSSLDASAGNHILLKEVNRILRDDGSVAIVEPYNEGVLYPGYNTGRMTHKEITAVMNAHAFSLKLHRVLGSSFFLLVFQRY